MIPVATGLLFLNAKHRVQICEWLDHNTNVIYNLVGFIIMKIGPELGGGVK